VQYYYIVRNGGQLEEKELCYVLGRLAIYGRPQVAHASPFWPLEQDDLFGLSSPDLHLIHFIKFRVDASLKEQLLSPQFQGRSGYLTLQKFL
jgi:hypothetical protein